MCLWGGQQTDSEYANEISMEESISRPDDAASVSKDDGSKAGKIRQTEVNRLSPVGRSDQMHPSPDGNEKSQPVSELNFDHEQSTSLSHGELRNNFSVIYM